MKKTKIVATIGPASDDEKILTNMIESGMNVARLNFSHGDYRWHAKIIKSLREIEKKKGVTVGILADLQGPRIRTRVNTDIKVKKGEKVILYDATSSNLPGQYAENIKSIGLHYPAIIGYLKKGNEILIQDGLIKMKVVKKNGKYLEAEMIDEGIIKNNKGVNIPKAELGMRALTEKDKKDLLFALGKNVDFIALSFVSSAEDIADLRKRIGRILKRNKNLPQIVAKIERREAIKNLDAILQETDAVMVARGDLGIEMEESKVAVLQKNIIEKSLKNSKPVIVATQMLGSMIRSPRPTRAEVSDVSNAVIDHADAVMLSEETAVGKYPVRAVRMMSEIIKRTEQSPYDDLIHGFLGDSRSSTSAAIANSAHELSKDSSARAIVVASISGFTARMIARHRPKQKIYVMTNNDKTYHQLTLLWGTEGFILPNVKTLDELIVRSIEVLKRRKLLKKKDKVVIVAGRPHVKREHMSLVKVEEIR
jgi:pyruvate kinase